MEKGYRFAKHILKVSRAIPVFAQVPQPLYYYFFGYLNAQDFPLIQYLWYKPHVQNFLDDLHNHCISRLTCGICISY